tara:strand:+ start:33191 stop:34942 length:1752 start_codon:yes stop_codon:yes gene_type:complete
MLNTSKFFLAALAFYSCLLFSCKSVPEPIIDMEADVSDFGLIDQNGDFHTLYYYTDAKAIVLYVQGNDCPFVREGIKDIKSVRKDFEDKDITFLMINSNVDDTRESIAVEAKEYDIDFPILKDKAQLVAEALQLHRTAEAIVLEPGTWDILYRGPVNSKTQNYLADALNAQLRGEVLAENYIKGKGTAINLVSDPSGYSSISYEKDIAPLLIEKCMVCHVEGGIAPWQMKNHETVLGWSAMMRQVLQTKRMPPYHADPNYGEFSHDLSLSTSELQTLVHWIDAGAKKDGNSDPLAKYQAIAPEWDMGVPDLVFELDEESVPADGIIDYRYQEHDINIDEDIWATGFQILPGNREVLHHVLVSVIYPDGFIEPIDRRSPWIDGLLAAWAPGGITEVFPENTGRAIPKGSRLHFQMHYTTNGKAQKDKSTVGIYYTNQKPANEYLMVGAYNTNIKIPPGDKRYENKAKYLFENDATLYALFPHMHFRGKAMKFTALYPDGKKEVLLNVPNYSFNWQRGYLFEEPLTIPARTVLYVDAVFDNSSQNTFNPAPEKTVYWGDFSFDEMLIGFLSFEYHYDASEDLSMK